MIIWLASYPKSGNTFLRALLSSYLFSQDGIFNFDLLKNIRQFPNAGVLRSIGVDIFNEKEVVKNYISAQVEINKRDKDTIRFLKTHNSLHEIDGNKFTDLRNSLGVIYIVRDPRTLIKSFANHNQITLEESLKKMTEFTILKDERISNGKISRSLTHLGTWHSHLSSWKVFDNYNKYILIRYEDLILKTEETLLKILYFIYNLNKKKFILDKNKLKKVINTTTFEKMSDLEKKINFSESANHMKRSKVTFFKYGPDKNKEDYLPTDLKKKIEKLFNREMIELGYL